MLRTTSLLLALCSLALAAPAQSSTRTEAPATVQCLDCPVSHTNTITFHCADCPPVVTLVAEGTTPCAECPPDKGSNCLDCPVCLDCPNQTAQRTNSNTTNAPPTVGAAEGVACLACPPAQRQPPQYINAKHHR